MLCLKKCQIIGITDDMLIKTLLGVRYVLLTNDAFFRRSYFGQERRSRINKNSMCLSLLIFCVTKNVDMLAESGMLI